MKSSGTAISLYKMSWQIHGKLFSSYWNISFWKEWSTNHFCSVLYKRLWMLGTQVNLGHLSHLLPDSYVLCADLSTLQTNNKMVKRCCCRTCQSDSHGRRYVIWENKKLFIHADVKSGLGCMVNPTISWLSTPRQHSVCSKVALQYKSHIILPTQSSWTHHIVHTYMHKFFWLSNVSKTPANSLPNV